MEGSTRIIMKKLITISIAVAVAFSAQVHAQAPAATSSSYFIQGQAAEKAGDPAAAEEFYKKALKLDPKNASAIYSLGQIKIHGPAIAAKGREEKLGAVMIPVFQLQGASLQEALDALGLMIEKQSEEKVTPNFVIEDPKQVLADRKISLNLKAMPTKAVMKYLVDQTGTKVRYDEHAVVFSVK